MKSLICILMISLWSFSASALCEKEALKAARKQAAKSWNFGLRQVVGTISESNFDETYGSGDYLVVVTNTVNSDEKELTVYMTAFSNADDSEFTCKVDEIVE